MDDKKIIELYLRGINEELKRKENVYRHLQNGGEIWDYDGKMPNEARFKRHRLMLAEALIMIEKNLNSY